MSRWRTLKRQVLMRRVPHCLISWRFLLPGQGLPVRLHRRVLFGAWPVLPRWQWGMILLYSTTLWWLCWGWLGLYRTLRSHSRKVALDHGVSVARQLAGLLVATFAHGIVPRDFYRFALYQRPERQWLDYIYEQELPHWHRLMSPQLGRKSLQLMTDKHDFSRAMAEHGIATVETVAMLQRGYEVGEQQLFMGRSLFLKPVCGARAKGCMTLAYNADTDCYALQFVNGRIKGKSAILARVRDCVATADYLVQPLLRNAADLAALAGSDTVATLRVISALIEGEPTVLMANLEFPAEQQGGVSMLEVDVEGGCLMAAHPSARDALDDGLIGLVLPQWSEVVGLCIDAHRCFSDLNSIGWDVVIDVAGVKLLEGNINWGVGAHQLLSGVPALETELIRAYR
ncbi:MAG: hypothetical protein CO187_01035 [Zetaproteobacteria bacterium CG_4_9_14_3_um_filter_53_7]|nr:MAG: hypothetical protein CO187_01035 [Zetaproteobacteria bacterium CG_4_9_14_3_um_filter_53_7]